MLKMLAYWMSQCSYWRMSAKINQAKFKTVKTVCKHNVPAMELAEQTLCVLGYKNALAASQLRKSIKLSKSLTDE